MTFLTLGTLWCACGGTIGTLEDGVLTYDVATATTESETFASYGTVTNVVKKGAGTLTISVSNAGYAGDVEVQTGILEDKAPPNKGVPTGIGSAKKVTVKGGGQFRDTWTAARSWDYQSTKVYSGTFYIEGAGPDGSGALYGNAAGGPGDRLFSLITLTGPATIGGARGCYGGVPAVLARERGREHQYQ